MPEDLALEKGLGDRGAVDGDEGPAPPRGVVVNRASHQLLSGPALPEDEHGGVGRRDLLDLAGHLPHHGGAGDEPPEGAALAQLAPQPVDLARRLGPVQRSLEENLEARGVERLGQVVVGALLHRLDRALDGALAGEHDDRRLGVVGPQGREEGEAVHAGHDEVADHDGGRLLGRALQRLDAVAGARDLVPPQSEEVGESLAGDVVILDDQTHDDASRFPERAPVSLAMVAESTLPALPRFGYHRAG